MTGPTSLLLLSLLQQYHLENEQNNSKIHLVINKIVSANDIGDLFIYCTQNAGEIFFTRLSLLLDYAAIKDPQLTKLIQVLNNSPCIGLDLCFHENELIENASSMMETLTKSIAPFACLPITINQVVASDIYSMRFKHKHLKGFQEAIIENIRNKAKLQISSPDPVQRNEKLNIIAEDSKKNILKQLLNKPISNNELPFIKVEVQHAEVIQQHISEEVEEEVNIGIENQLQELERFNGKLISYEDFSAMPKKIDKSMVSEISLLVEQEFFVNLPNAIKYFSEQAAEQMAESIQYFAALNMENLPKGFVLKKTALGEIVLDYDNDEINRKYNPFTPMYSESNYEEVQPIYDLDYLKKLPHKQLINIWIRFGESKVQEFLEKIEACDRIHSGFRKLIIYQYLYHFPQWDHLVENDSFMTAVDKISSYDASQYSWLSQFVLDTGSSKHDLAKTILAFDEFWIILSSVCKANNINRNDIKINWETPVGGNPVVYMERLITIISKARNPKEQLDCLNGLKLSNIGPYYGIKYEGYKVVSSEMSLSYDRSKQNAKPFSIYHRQFTVTINDLKNLVNWYHKINGYDKSDAWIINSSKNKISAEEFLQLQNKDAVFPYKEGIQIELPYGLFSYREDNKMYELISRPGVNNEQFYVYAYRYLGQQDKGIFLPSFKEAMVKYSNEYRPPECLNKEKLFNLVMILSHEKYSNAIPISYLTQLLDYMNNHRLLEIINDHIFKLFKLDVKLSDIEAFGLYNIFSGMNSREFENMGLEKELSINKIFDEFIKNKHGMLRILEYRSKNSSKWPLVYAIDTANYFAQDQAIYGHYMDDLYLLGEKINGDIEELYYEELSRIPSRKEYENRIKREGRANNRHGNETINTEIDRLMEIDKKAANSKMNAIKAKIDQVKNFLLQAVKSPKPNNLDYGFKLIIKAERPFNFTACIKIFTAIEALGQEFMPHEVEKILASNRIKLLSQQINTAQTNRDKFVNRYIENENSNLNPEIKNLFILLNLALDTIQLNSSGKELIQLDLNYMLSPEWKIAYKAYSGNDFLQLKEMAEEKYHKFGTLLESAAPAFLKKIIAYCLDLKLRTEFTHDNGKDFLTAIAARIKTSPYFEKFNKFDSVLKSKEIESLGKFCKKMVENINLLNQENSFIDFFNQKIFTNLNYELWFALLDQLSVMSNRDYLKILQVIFSRSWDFAKPKPLLDLIDCLNNLDANFIPTKHIEQILSIINHEKYDGKYNDFIQKVTNKFKLDSNDEILSYLFLQSKPSFGIADAIVSLTDGIKRNREALAQLFNQIDDSNISSLIVKFNSNEMQKNEIMLEILAKCFALNHSIDRNLNPTTYLALIDELSNLNEGMLKALQHFFKNSSASILSLFDNLRLRNTKIPFSRFLMDFEKSPYANRCIADQFECGQVHRVVNHVSDLLNDTICTYEHRKKLMEYFMFINKAGYELPIYECKAAKDLSNEEIKNLFLALKSNEIKYPTLIQKRLYALGLMREAMYRSAGQFPYSTQIIAIVDSMMRSGHVVSKIMTGQGKSLIDFMKAALLWLDHDRVDITTSSIDDAKRDIANYASFFDMLGIPYSDRPIMATSSVEDFKTNGINISTFSQLALFFSRSLIRGNSISGESDLVAAVINEFDHSILRDLTIYRCAASSVIGLSGNHDWIYDEVNQFVKKNRFLSNITSQSQDISELKEYLIQQAKINQKPYKFLHKINDEQFNTWINSAILVNFHLKNNIHFVIPKEQESRIVNGLPVVSHVIKILMKDGKVSQHSQFGDGMQQLLYAKLNREMPNHRFTIEPETTTIISTNNRNLLDSYLMKGGVIWGSSATVGSRSEMVEQFEKYNIAFSEIPSHQVSIVQFNKPILCANEEMQFATLYQQILKSSQNTATLPHLVFCKDIDTTERLFAFLSKSLNHSSHKIQFYTGLGDEAYFVKQASIPGMITITTSVLTRNTDILYDKKIGMVVWHTSIDSTISMAQKDGRTGRQGSPGSVNYLFNLQDVPNSDIQLAKDAADKIIYHERAFNEELYVVLGCLLQNASSIPSSQYLLNKEDFWATKWSTFSRECEYRYRTSKIQHTYQQDKFVNEVMQNYRAMFDGVVDASLLIDDDQLFYRINHKYSLKQAYIPFPAEVKLSDCKPSSFYAYFYLSFQQDVSIVDHANKELIKTELKLLFDRLNHLSFERCNIEYMRFLTSNAKLFNKALLKQAHQEFLNDFLHGVHDEYLKESSSNGFFKKFVTFESRLSKVLNNNNYLTMFQIITSVFVQDEYSDLDLVKSIIKAVINEYIKNKLFTLVDTAAIFRQTNFDDAANYDNLISMLCDIQKNIAKRDIDMNKSSWLRTFKPINTLGSSDSQTMVSQLINLIVSLSRVNPKIIVQSLWKLFGEIQPMSDQLNNLTLDEIMLCVNVPKTTDYANQQVLRNAMLNALVLSHAFQTLKSNVSTLQYVSFFNPAHSNKNLTVPALLMHSLNVKNDYVRLG